MPDSGMRPVETNEPKQRAHLLSARGAALRPIDFPVIGMGASAGGLVACTKLLDAFRAPSGMAFILVQHLDPTRESLTAERVAEHTSLTVLEAADGMPVERNHLYIMPPASFLTLPKAFFA